MEYGELLADYQGCYCSLDDGEKECADCGDRVSDVCWECLCCLSCCRCIGKHGGHPDDADYE